jgi:glycyl-tRNA synthetase beta chain
MAELLFELLSEEIPARMQARAAEDLKRLVGEGLKAAGLEFTEARAFATPRRLALVVDGLPAARADVSEERRGPRVGAPEQAVQGFLKAAGLASLDQAEKRETGKGEFWFAVIKKKGGSTAEALPSVLGPAVLQLQWPKSMAWGSGGFTWVRPLRSILAMFEGQKVELNIRLNDGIIPSGTTTFGHRFLSKGPIEVVNFADYVAKLKAAYVILDPAERQKIILDGAKKLCAEAQVSLVSDESLLDEVTGLVEWPVPLMGRIDDVFLNLPYQVLVSSMRTHQRYFPTWKSDMLLANRFVVIANNVARDGGKTIIDGNERVLRARLSDAKFFWDQDRKVRLEDRLPALKDIVFHAKLGTQFERVERIVKLAGEIANSVPAADARQVEQAAWLCKADLVTDMVGEFPELQGIIGRYYALGEKLPIPVADAIGEHYTPAGPNDRCPTAPVSVAVALADKLDALTSFWAINEKPTGSRDPFALRRAALGVIRIILESRLRLPLTELLIYGGRIVMATMLANVRADLSRRMPFADQLASDSVLRQLLAVSGRATEALRKSELDVVPPQDWEIAQATSMIEFIADRFKLQVRERGVRHDVVDAVFALGGEDDLVRLLARVEALQSFLGTEAGKNLLTAYGRAANIVRAEEKKDKTLTARIAGAPDAALLEQAEEKAVASALHDVERALGPALEAEDFAGAMKAFAGLRAPIDSFFEKVTVNVTDKPDLRLNRLRLLNQIRATMDSVADFSRIEG